MRIANPIKFFVRDSRASGILLLCCTVVSMWISNTDAGTSYISFWHHNFSSGSTVHGLPSSPLHVVNDVLMSLFFFLVGMEIKREVLYGELNTVQKAMLPLFSAVGGMLFPAFIYLVFCHSSYNYTGWGIPMATDIAFSLGLLSLLGNRVPLTLRILLTAIAIIDDIGGILAIAIFYTASLHWSYVLYALALIAILLIINRYRAIPLGVFLVGGVVLWYFVYNSGIHATISGVLLAILLPSSFIHKLETALHTPIYFIILPLFALANTAIIIPHDILALFNSSINYGVLVGLVVGKPLGIFVFSWLATVIGIGRLPGKVNFKQVLGMGMLAGIGFTVALFIATLAFPDDREQLIAKLAVISGSFCSGMIGYFFLRYISKKKVRQ